MTTSLTKSLTVFTIMFNTIGLRGLGSVRMPSGVTPNPSPVESVPKSPLQEKGGFAEYT